MLFRSWPECIYLLGQTFADQGNTKEAFAYFQRLYVLYDGYVDWAAKGYLHSGLCLEKLDQRADAIKTYQEFLGKPEFAKTPEFPVARQQLQRLGGGGS